MLVRTYTGAKITKKIIDSVHQFFWDIAAERFMLRDDILDKSASLADAKLLFEDLAVITAVNLFPTHSSGATKNNENHKIGFSMKYCGERFTVRVDPKDDGDGRQARLDEALRFLA